MQNRRLLIATCVIISAIVALNASIAKADIHVYDNNNQYLGILLDLTNDELSVFLPSVNAGWHIEYGSIDPCDEVYFDSANCTGTPYIYKNDPMPLVTDISNSPIGGFYIPDINGKRTFTPGSRYDYNCQCQTSTEPNDEYIPLTQIQMPFTVPIALPLRFEVETQTVTQTEIMPFPIVVPPKNQ